MLDVDRARVPPQPDQGGVSDRRDSGNPPGRALPAYHPLVRFYVPELDGLRFFAFAAVFFHHALPQNTEAWAFLGARLSEWVASIVRAGGIAGVDLFFTLSAYLITELLNREFEGTGAIRVGFFYMRRGARIWPLYFTFLGAIWVIQVGLAKQPSAATPYFPWFAVFMGNWKCVLSGFPSSPIAPLWSVSIEEQFYLLWPLLFLWLRRRGLVRPAAAMACAFSVACRVFVALTSGGGTAMGCNTLCRLEPMAAGVLLATFPISSFRSWRGSAWLVTIGVVVQILGTQVTGSTISHPMLAALVQYPTSALASFMVLGGILATPTSALSRGLTRPTFVQLGRISYGLYVFHQGSLLLTHRFLTGRVLGSLLVAAVITIGLAKVSYRFLERPALRLKERWAVVPSRPGG